MVEESPIFKDRWISFLRLEGEVCGRFSKNALDQQIPVAQKLLGNRFACEWEPVQWDRLLKKKNVYILFPYIFETDAILLNSGIIYRYIIERGMDKCKQSFILKILLESVAEDMNCGIRIHQSHS